MFDKILKSFHKELDCLKALNAERAEEVQYTISRQIGRFAITKYVLDKNIDKSPEEQKRLATEALMHPLPRHLQKMISCYCKTSNSVPTPLSKKRLNNFLKELARKLETSKY